MQGRTRPIGRQRHGRPLRLEPLEERQLLTTVAFHWPELKDAKGTESALPAAQALTTSLDLEAVTDDQPWQVIGRYADLTGIESVESDLLTFVGPLTPSDIVEDTLYRIGKTADAFLIEQRAGLGLEDPVAELMPFSVSTDDLGMTHLRHHQFSDGIPVYGSEVLVHLGGDMAVDSANGRLVSSLDAMTTPMISATDAVQISRNIFADQFGTVDCGCGSSATTTTLDNPGEPEMLGTTLYVLDRSLYDPSDTSEPRLVWEVPLSREKPTAFEYYYVDAMTGEVVEQQTGLRFYQREIYDCSYRPQYGCYLDHAGYFGPLVYYFGRSEGKPPRGPNPMGTPYYGSTDVDDVYDIMAELHDFYQTTFGRNGANDRGGLGDGSSVAYDVVRVWTFVDALGYEPGCAWFGQHSIAICTDQTELDLLGHEYTHGVVWHSHFDTGGSPVGMVYSGESGALEESFCDMMGEAFEVTQTGETDWMTYDHSGPMRDFADPPSLSYYPSGSPATPCPDRYRDPNFYTGSENEGGVHWNSTVPSKAFYLASEGGQFNGYEITGVGIEKAQQIWYRAATTYYTRTETFNGAYSSIMQAAQDLYGAEYGEEVVGEVRKALQAVEMHLPRTSELVTVEEVTASASEVSVEFSHDMDMAPMLAAPGGDGSITAAVSIVNMIDGAEAITAEQFSYDSATHTLTWTGDSPLTAGTYELQLRGDLLNTTGGTPLRGGASGLAFSIGEFGPVTNIQAGAGDLAVEGYSTPTMADLNGDGLLDLIVGEKTAADEGRVRIYPNTGTAAVPTFDSFGYAQSAGR